MSFLNRFKKKGAASPGQPEPKTMEEFLAEAEGQIDAWIAADDGWFHHLPYSGAMSADDARSLEIERLAIWNRVIHDAARSQLPGLRWDCRNDDRSCPDCLERHGRIYPLADLDALRAEPRHLGCRCELIPVRDI